MRRAIYKEEAIAALRELQKCADAEKAHVEADEILCRMLESLGTDYEAVTAEYDKINKWYA